MELDVRLARDADEAWGFRLIGGIDFGMPLTVVKVIPNSSAEKSGLRNGDVVNRIDDQDACDLSHDEARDVVAGAGHILTLGVTRGLYDPVIDDQEPIYEPIEPDDFDQPSQPTEEEIKEIERKSSLLASAIDKTIKCIEEYKEQAGIEKTDSSKTSTESSDTEDTLNSDNIDVQVVYNAFAKVVETKVYDQNEMESDWVINRKVINNTDKVNQLKDTGEQPINFTVSRRSSNPANKKTSKGRVKHESSETTVNGNMNGVTDELEVDVPGYRSVQFNPEEIMINRHRVQVFIDTNQQEKGSKQKMYVAENGEILGTDRGIVDGLEEAIVDSEVAKEMGKPGITEDKIAELISGESEMLREAHVMGLSRVLKSHMHRPNDDDSSVDFKKIKPIIESLKDSEVLKALNEDLTKTKKEKKIEVEKKWTTFLQKPQRTAPKGKFGYYKHLVQEEEVESPYKVKIVKQPKPKVAPDYKPETEDFETGPLPWEQRAANEPPPPPVSAEDPILIPEETPEFYEAVDPLPESEVPDLEETDIPLPSEKEEEESEETENQEEEVVEEVPGDQGSEEIGLEAVEETEEKVEMEENKLAEQLMMSVQSMVDPNAPLEQQLAQMRAQLAALAQLPCVIQQTLECVTKQLSQITHKDSTEVVTEAVSEAVQETLEQAEESQETSQQEEISEEKAEEEVVQQEEEVKNVEEVKPTQEELERLRREEQEMLEEQTRIEKQKKEIIEQQRLESEARQLKQRPTPRVGKPAPMFGPLVPAERPMVLPGGRKWRRPQDAFNETLFAETLSAQAEIIKGKAMGINFMKYEKPPVSLDHLQNSDVYKMIHDMEQAPSRRVDMLTPVMAEADYREKCRSMTPCVN